MTKPESADSWRQMLTEFADRAAAIEAEILAVRERKRPLAVRAMAGDRKARDAVAALDGEIAKLVAERETAGQAVEQAQTELRQAEQRERIAAEVARLERLRDLSEARVAAAEAFEVALTSLMPVLAALIENERALGAELRWPHDESEAAAVASWRQKAGSRLNEVISRYGLDTSRIGHDPLPGSVELGWLNLTDAGLHEMAEQRVAAQGAPAAA